MSTTPDVAARTGDLEGLRAALDADPDAAARRYGPASFTLLMLASASGQWHAVSLLLAAGSDPNALDVSEETALTFAASGRWPDVVTALTAAGADVNHRDSEGMTALHRAVLGGINPNESALSTVRALLAAGADASIPDKRGRLPYHEARQRRWTWTVPLLGWDLSGYYNARRDDPVVRILQDAAAAQAR